MCAATIGAVACWEAHTVVAELQAGPKKKIVKAVEPVLKQKPKRTLVPAPPEAGAQTILLIGSDRRVASQGLPGARSDTTIVVRIDPKRHRIGLLSIPRDLYVEIPGHGHDRINAAFEEGGERLLTRTVRDTLGLKIDHFVEVDFRGFRKIVHDLGGIWLPVDQRYYNRNLGTPGTNYAAIDLGPGYQRLNGGQALEFARYRHYDSDLYRAARQQLVIRETLRQSFAHKLDFLRIVRLAHDFADATTSDIDSVRELWGLANAVRGARVDRRHDRRLRLHRVRRRLPHRRRHAAEDGGAGVSSGSRRRRSRARRGPSPPRRPRPRRAEKPVLYPDGGRAQALLEPLVPRMRRCVPTELPPGYGWPYEDAARAYALDGHPAVALYATSGSGRSILWMFTTWSDPPILASPTATRTVGGRTFDLYTDSGRLRQIAWQVGPTRVWLTNTLRNDLTNAQMLALAESCRGA